MAYYRLGNSAAQHNGRMEDIRISMNMNVYI